MYVVNYSPHRLAPFLLLACSLLQLTATAQSKPVRRVLILNEVGISYPLISLVDQGVRTALSDAPYRVEFYREYMDTTMFPDHADQTLIREFLLRKYEHHKPDVIITVGSSPLRFMVETHRQFFPGVPIVFCFANVPGGDSVPLDADFTGVGSEIAPSATITAALRLLPKTRHLAVVGGSAPYDRRQQSFVREQLRAFEGRLDISYLTDLSTPALLNRLKHLPSHTIVLLTAYGRDTEGNSYNANESGPLIVAASNSPVFSMIDRYLGHGEVGGEIASALGDGTIVGGMVRRLLSGERATNIPIVKSGDSYMFDSEALKRWGLKERDLPPGSSVMNRRLTFWEAYKSDVISGVLLFLLEAVAIVGLLWHRERRKRVEKQLRKSEERFTTLFRRSPLPAVITRISGGEFIDVSETFEQQTGWRRDEVLGRTANDINAWVDPDQQVDLRKQVLTHGNLQGFEAPLRRKDGQTRVALLSSELIELNGEKCILTVIADISERKAAEDVLSNINRRLIGAHEEERTRIARELHDDIGQRLVILGVDLETLKPDLLMRPEAKKHFREVTRSVSDLIGDVQAISHSLHSSKLEYLGLEAASASFCRELGDHQDFKIEFSAYAVPKSIPIELSLSLFRVLQEALNNAVKHSGAREFEVSLVGSTNEIRLRVHDSGKGFDVLAATRAEGLGLTSMKERLKLVGGTLSIKSKPQRGTTVLARAPLPQPLDTSGDAVA